MSTADGMTKREMSAKHGIPTIRHDAQHQTRVGDVAAASSALTHRHAVVRVSAGHLVCGGQ